MPEMTHHQARTLLQISADRSLEPAERSALESHLAACNACREYAGQLSRLEYTLRENMHARWDGYRPALNRQAIKNKIQAKPVWTNPLSHLNALGKVTMMATLLLGYLLIANLVRVGGTASKSGTPSALPTPNEPASTFLSNSPTPPTQSATLQRTSLPCETIPYIVQANDTLESIAVRHGITKEDILEYNKEADSLFSNTIFTGMELNLPVCRSTPSYTASAGTNTLAITPTDMTFLTGQPE